MGKISTKPINVKIAVKEIPLQRNCLDLPVKVKGTNETPKQSGIAHIEDGVAKMKLDV